MEHQAFEDSMFLRAEISDVPASHVRNFGWGVTSQCAELRLWGYYRNPLRVPCTSTSFLKGAPLKTNMTWLAGKSPCSIRNASSNIGFSIVILSFCWEGNPAIVFKPTTPSHHLQKISGSLWPCGVISQLVVMVESGKGWSLAHEIQKWVDMVDWVLGWLSWRK